MPASQDRTRHPEGAHDRLREVRTGDGGTGRSIIIDASGNVLHEAGHGPEMMPIEIDLDRVRRERERGVRGLGQTLKSFRDRPVDFPVYQRSGPTETYLHSLGPLVKPARPLHAEPVHRLDQAKVTPGADPRAEPIAHRQPHPGAE